MEERYEKAKKLSEEIFKRLFGIKRETFEKAWEILQNAYKRSIRPVAVHPNYR